MKPARGARATDRTENQRPKPPEAKTHNRLRRRQCSSEAFREQAQGFCQNRAARPAEVELNLHEKIKAN